MHPKSIPPGEMGHEGHRTHSDALRFEGSVSSIHL